MTGLPLRVRVAIAFSLTTAAALIGLGTFVYVRVETTLTDQTRSALVAQLDALTQLPAGERREATSSMTRDTFGQVLAPSGRPLASSPQLNGRILAPEDLPRTPDEEVTLERPVRLLGEDEQALLIVRDVGGQVLLVGSSREAAEDALGGVLTQLLIGGPLVLLLASAAGYVVAGSALRPIERIRHQAAVISASNSESRLPLPAARDEIHRLGQTLNEMLDRLEAGLIRERRFVAEASHELRTPLALLKMELDLAVSRPRSEQELLDAVRSANDDVDRLSRLADDLLLLAAADEGRLALDVEEVDVGELLHGAAERFATRGAVESRAIRVVGEPPLVLYADRARLDRALSNLVDNALRHGGGDVDLCACSNGESVSITVTDRGPGVDAAFAVHAFDPFAREPGARTTPGSGLGLSIVRAIVEEHRGTVSLAAAASGHGTVASITLPA